MIVNCDHVCQTPKKDKKHNKCRIKLMNYNKWIVTSFLELDRCSYHKLKWQKRSEKTKCLLLCSIKKNKIIAFGVAMTHQINIKETVVLKADHVATTKCVLSNPAKTTSSVRSKPSWEENISPNQQVAVVSVVCLHWKREEELEMRTCKPFSLQSCSPQMDWLKIKRHYWVFD